MVYILFQVYHTVNSSVNSYKENQKGKRGRGRQSATPTPPLRLPVPTEDVGHLGERVKWSIGGPNPKPTGDLLMEGLESPIGSPNPESTRDLRLRVLSQFEVGDANW
ncbi:hypothetical protein CRG98_044925 [Punica granatum]|uniref:Uncharacterized protein n=1 Tax=Punica granatum TaxID=22663 RepID=A0A2I0HSL6_PUNGR|nr:hypothetical protein CRG98_044925 [Punica granatum]